MVSISKLIAMNFGKRAIKKAIKTNNISDSIKNAEKTLDNVSSLMDSFTKDMSKVFTNYTDSIKKLGGAMDDTDGNTVKEEKKSESKKSGKDEETDNDESNGEKKKAVKKEKSGDGLLKKAFDNAQNVISSIDFSSIKSGLDYIDKYTNANNKLERISGNAKEASGLKQKVFEAANDSSTSYTDMINTVSDLGSLDAFKSNDERVYFADIMQKSLKLDGSSQSLSDVTSSMSDGSINGDEFSSLVSSAPTIGAAMSDATGMSISDLQTLAEQGMVTAEVLKNAMLASGTEISEDFANQPRTFADVWTQVTNKVMNALDPLIQSFSSMINSSAFQGAINVIIAGLTYVSNLASSLITFIMENGNVIRAILLALGAVLLVVLAASIASWFMMYLPIMLIVGAIALIIYILGELGVSFQDVFSFVGGLIGGLYAVFYNVFMGIWNIVATVVNFIVNAFSNTTDTLKIAFNDLLVSIGGIFVKIAKGIQDLINLIPGFDIDISSKFAQSVQSLDENNSNMKKDSGYREVLKKVEYLDISETASTGKQFASNTLTKVQDIFNSSSNPSKNIFDSDKFSLDDNGLGSSNSPLSTEITGSKGAIDVNMAEEDTQYLRDLAEREYINKFNTTSLSPNVSITFGDVHETADAEKVSKRIAQILREQIAVAAEGAY